MKRGSLWKRIQYWFDCVMSRGPIAMSILLFAVTVATVGTIGIIAYFVSDDGGILYQIWTSLMYTLDPGNLADVSTDNIPYLILMSVAALCGLFLTSVLIGIISNGVESKLGDLHKGTSVVQEQGHTVIIGFNSNIYTLLRELIEANANKKSACIVILGEQPKEKMEDAVSTNVPHTGNTRIICRSGNLHADYALARCSVETSRSVIINVYEDSETVKILLALSAYLKDKELVYPDMRFVASIQNSQNVEAATIAGENRAEIVFAKDAIARIISNTCRQHGLSQVLSELFNYSGNEMYFESIPALEGKTIKEAMLSFSNAIVVGIQAKNRVKLNPPPDTVIEKEDQVILLEEDDSAYQIHPVRPVEETKISNRGLVCAQASDHLVVLGSNDKLPIILAEYDKYVKPGTQVIVLDNDMSEAFLGPYYNLTINVCGDPVTRDLLYRYVKDGANNILLLNDDSLDPEESDSQTLLRLILLRDIADKTGCSFAITTEMRSVDNQRLAACARVDDFVVGSSFADLLMTQISEDFHMAPLITELLDESGSELYMKFAADYVMIGTPVDGYTIAESAARKGEVFVGYRLGKNDVVVNPNKEEPVIFSDSDQIIVIAKN